MNESSDESQFSDPSLAALNNTSWVAAIDDAKSYQDLLTVLYKHEQDFEKHSEEAISIQWLRALCSLSFSRKISIYEPFEPHFENAAAMESFKPEKVLQFLSDIMDSNFDNHFLRARIGDILWSLKKPKNRDHLVQSVDSYLKAPLEYDRNWFHLHEPCWERAIVICNATADAVGNRREAIEEKLYQQISDSNQDTYWRQLLAKLVLNNSPILHNKSEELGDIFNTLGVGLSESDKHTLTQSCFEISGGFYSRAKDRDACISAKVSVADSILAEATEIYNKEHNGRFFQAADRYDRAIQIFLSVPHSSREQYQIVQKIGSAQSLQKECNIESLKLMPSHAIDPKMVNDMQWVVDEAIDAESPLESLRGLASLTFPLDMETLKSEVAEKENTRTLSSFMTGPSIHLESDGRVSEKAAGIDLLSDKIDKKSKEYAEWFLHQQLTSYQMKVEFTAVSVIQFVCRKLRDTHRFTERYFIELAFHSSFVPENRNRIVGKGLYLGCIGEFGAAMHILAPQLEGIVRQHLHELGIDTNHMPTGKKGVEYVTGLSSLIENHRADCERIYSPETTFEIDALFCQSAFLNLRNDVAHGILDDVRGDSRFTMYAWVFFLKLVLSPFNNSDRQGV